MRFKRNSLHTKNEFAMADQFKCTWCKGAKAHTWSCRRDRATSMICTMPIRGTQMVVMWWCPKAGADHDLYNAYKRNTNGGDVVMWWWCGGAQKLGEITICRMPIRGIQMVVMWWWGKEAARKLGQTTICTMPIRGIQMVVMCLR